MDNENVFFLEEGDDKYFNGGLKLLGVNVASRFPRCWTGYRRGQ